MQRQLTAIVNDWFAEAIEAYADSDPFVWDITVAKDDEGHPALWVTLWLPGLRETIIQTNYVITNPVALKQEEVPGLIENMSNSLRSALAEQQQADAMPAPTDEPLVLTPDVVSENGLVDADHSHL